jgi:type IV pilus assembly protein PilX
MAAHHSRRLPPLRAQQRGMSLVTTLVMLIVVLVLGFSAMQIWRTEFMLTGNQQFVTAAFNAATGATGTAEKWLSTSTNAKNAGFISYGTPYLYPIGYLETRNIDFTTMTWDDTNSLAVGNQGTQRYLIEMLGQNLSIADSSSLNTGGRASTGCSTVNLYRIVGRGTSARGATRIVQITYTVLSC